MNEPIVRFLPTGYITWQQVYADASKSPTWHDSNSTILHRNRVDPTRRSWSDTVVRYEKQFIEQQAKNE